MLKYLVFSFVIFVVNCGNSPHGEEYLASVSSSERKKIANDVMEDLLLDVVGLINKYGYPVETYEIQTEDGYIITTHRIPRGITNVTSGYRQAVLLMHGIMSSSADWIVNGPDKGLGYILADEGYDVWLPNARGNYYSRKHVTLHPNDSQYWSFSWHEIGYFDIPAVIDYIFGKTGKKKLHYIGHSQGTTSFFVLGSTKTDYNEKIMSMHALSPIAYMNNMRNTLTKNLFEYIDQYNFMFELLLQTEENSLSIFSIKNELCADGSELFENCKNLYQINDNGQLNMTKLPVYLSHFPAGSSVKQIKHFKQLYKSGKFQQFDYGYVDNMKLYGKPQPPLYDLGQITTPVVLYYAPNDDLADIKDIQKLSNELNNTIDLFKVPSESFTHYNFVVANDIRKLLYDTLLYNMNLFKSNV